MRTRGHSCVHVRSAEEEILKNITAPDYLEIRDCGVKGKPFCSLHLLLNKTRLHNHHKVLGVSQKEPSAS